jgi:hypothetical protein
MVTAGKKGLFHDIGEDWIEPNGTYHPKIRQYYSDDIAETVVHYELCRMLVALCKSAFADSRGFLACRAEALTHSTSVLSIVPFATSISTTGMRQEYFGLVCLLITVLVASPSELHREFAKDTMNKFGLPNGLVGASEYHPIIRWQFLKTIWERSELLTDGVEVRDILPTQSKPASTEPPETLQSQEGITEGIKLPVRKG